MPSKTTAPSSTFLWHYTKNFDNLTSIIINGFKPSPCKERQDFLGQTTKAIPMVCFTNLPYYARQNHKQKYGSYCIALKQRWASHYGICPVIYCRKNGKLTQILRSLQTKILCPTILDQLYGFCKPYSDCKHLSSKAEKAILNRYDEREWRYVASSNEDIHLIFSFNDIHAIYVHTLTEQNPLLQTLKIKYPTIPSDRLKSIIKLNK